MSEVRRQMRLLAVSVLAVMLALATWWALSRDTAVVHADTGPTIVVGAATLASGTVEVPISATGSGFAAFTAFNLHLRWDPSNFKFLNATTAGGFFDNSQGHVACSSYIADPDGGGFTYGCFFVYSNTTVTSPGLLATFVLAPLQTGCSTLHLLTYGPPDNGNSTNGTFTVSAALVSPQSNTYVDGSATDTGATCVAGTPTPGTPLATPTNTPAPTFTSTPGGGPTPTPINATVGPDIVVGSTAMVGGKISVPIFDSGAGFNAYTAFVVHLRWDRALYQFDSVSTAGSVLAPNGGKAYCEFGGNNHLPDADGGGMEFACLSLAGPIVSTGPLVTMTLDPIGFGCSILHLETVGPPDNGGSSYGTFTISADYNYVQDNRLVDGSACNNPPPTNTPTETPTASPTVNPAESWMKVPDSANLFLMNGTQTFTFDEVMFNQHDPNGLGGFSFDVHFDPLQYQQPAVDLTPAISLFSAAGRTLTCSIGTPVNGDVHVACASTGPFGTGPQWVGAQIMAHVTLTPQSQLVESIVPQKENGDVSTVKDDQVTVTNSCGQALNDGTIQPLPGQPECQGNPLQGVGPSGVLLGNPNGGETTVTIRRLEGDVMPDCQVNISDMQLEASKFGTSVGSVLYNDFYDVSSPIQHGDGEIDISDVQFVYGRFGSTCANPVPPQPPQPAP